MHDLGIIGSGPGGYVAAERAGQAGLDTVIFEKDELGGVCLNTGCIPTKTLLNSVKHLSYARDAKAFGVMAENVGFDFKAIMKRKKKVVKKLVAGVGTKMKHNKVQVVNGEAVIQERTAKGIVVKCGDDTYEFKNVIIATGSLAAIPPIEGLDREQILTNVEALELEKLPEKMVVIGGGVIGMEFTDIFSTLGGDVTIVEMMPEVMPSMDSDLAAMLRQNFEKRGVEFHLSAKVTKVDGKTVHFEKDGETQSLAADEVLVSVGRTPNCGNCGLENIGVETEKGIVKVDEKCRTNVPGVYAIGDVTGGALLAHTASRAGEVVVNNLTGREDRFRPDAVPWVEYTHPEVAGVGLTEDQAKAGDIEVDIRKLPMAYAGRFVAETHREEGFCKILAEPATGRVLGVHMIGGSCSEMIYGAAMALEMEMTVDELEEVIFPHPTVSEIIRETTFAFREK
ncbi:MAG: dihydrolipoyl dehydrogenase [Lentisphaeria bacterium]